MRQEEVSKTIEAMRLKDACAQMTHWNDHTGALQELAAALPDCQLQSAQLADIRSWHLHNGYLTHEDEQKRSEIANKLFKVAKAHFPEEDYQMIRESF